VQGFAAHIAGERDEVVQVVCYACGSVHFINRKQEAENDRK
jgi:RNase P subunit RPR2